MGLEAEERSMASKGGWLVPLVAQGFVTFWAHPCLSHTYVCLFLCP